MSPVPEPCLCGDPYCARCFPNGAAPEWHEGCPCAAAAMVAELEGELARVRRQLAAARDLLLDGLERRA